MRFATVARIGLAVGAVAAAALVPSAALAQCAMCKTALDGPVEPAHRGVQT